MACPPEAGSRPSSPARAVSRWTRLTRGERRSLAGMGVFVLLLHVVGWGTMALFVAPAGYRTGDGQVLGFGLGLVAYTLGMRHAFDADHIAAIDNTTRKLLEDGRKPLSVGFWFSLGHSTVVFVLCLLLALGIRTLAGQVRDDSSALQSVTGVVGTTVSGVFLLLIGGVNLAVLLGMLAVFRRMRAGEHDEAELERQLARRGLLNRVLGRATRAVTRSRHMYPVGLLFGLGFDTASEVSLLVLAGGAAAFALPWYAILVLPVLFAAGMSLLDSADGCLMRFAYGWAFARPVRKVYYNITVTGLSVIVALVIGLQEVVGLLAEEAGVTSGPLGWVAGLDIGSVGFVVVGLFVVVWAVALAVWKFGRVEQRWSRPLPE